MIIASRAFGTFIDGKETTSLIPYADMLNHSRPKSAKYWYCLEKQGFVMTAVEDIPQGAQVFDTYGTKSNRLFFMNYGFVPQSNPFNDMLILAKMNESDPMFNQKMDLL